MKKKHIYFRMVVDKPGAIISIDISHPDLQERFAYYEKFESLEKILEESLEEKWIWENYAEDINGKNISRIYKSLPGVNIYDENDWPTLISFFKTRIIKLDNFWNEYKAFFLT